MKQCNSVRPAFVWEAHRDDVVTELMYIYIPMGLERQHRIQSSVLARFCSHELASCYLAVASEKLGVGYLRDACTCIIPEASQKHGGRTGIMRNWQDLLDRHKLLPCYNIGAEQVMPTSAKCWAGVQDLILNMAPKDYHGALNVIDCLMRHVG